MNWSLMYFWDFYFKIIYIYFLLNIYNIDKIIKILFYEIYFFFYIWEEFFFENFKYAIF